MKAIRVLLKWRRNDLDVSLYLRWWNSGLKKYEHEFLPFRIMNYPPKTQEDKERWRQAEITRNEKEADLLSSFTGSASLSKKKTPFISYFETINKNLGWKSTLFHLKNFPRANTLLYHVNEDFVIDLKNFLLTRCNLSPNSANCYFQKIKACLHIAEEDKIINNLSWRRIGNIKVARKKIEALTQVEFELLAKTPLKSRGTARGFLFSCLTGLRYSDTKKLTFGEIDFTKNEINLTQKKTGNVVGIPLVPAAKDLALENIPAGTLPHSSSLVFDDLGSPQTVNRELKAWEKLVKPKMHYHLSRATFASNIYEQTEDIYAVSRLLGHQNVGTTQQYLRITGKKLKNVVQIALGNWQVR